MVSRLVECGILTRELNTQTNLYNYTVNPEYLDDST